MGDIEGIIPGLPLQLLVSAPTECVESAHMPIVFIHGVANRRDHAYLRDENIRNALFRRFLGPVIEDPPDTPVTNPYWGDSGAAFRWNHRSLPGSGIERFGPDDGDELLISAHLAGETPDESRILVDTAARSVADAVDLLLTFAAPENDDETAVEEFADLADRVTALVPELTGSRGLELAGSDEEALDHLISRIGDTPSQAVESFGATQLWERFGESLVRMRSAAARISSRGALSVARAPMHSRVALFLGDVLAYVAQRGDVSDPGPIVRTVVSGLDDARHHGGKLVVVAHSMGGNIVYDVLSQYRPDLRVDVLVTVGSQVGLFAELGLLRADVAAGRAPDAPVDRLPNVDRWLNVFDLNDLLGFATDGIFAGSADHAYSTGRGLVAAHSAYFRLPSFYRRLAARLAE
ncbi:hypothetical protein [Actinoplanes sp. NPDC026619]|uniref:hypothetical protein n=1 Tax=Actinoplanes sp. NPDC026619 TaxID=3155798 RepID=UPI00340AAFD7